MAVRRVVVEFLGDDKSLGSTTRQAEVNTASLEKRIQAVGRSIMGAYAVRTVLRFADGLIDAAQAAQVSDNRIKSVATSMGVFGFEIDKVTKRLIDYADKTAKATGIDQNSVKAAQAKILTFISIAKTAGTAGAMMDRATHAALDLSAVGFGSVTMAAAQVGKALQDPLKGLVGLRRVGVTFTDSEIDMVKAMMKVGDLAGAQAILMHAIEQQVGGAAEATSTAASRMKVSWSQLQEQLGQALLPVFNSLMNVLSGVIGWFSKLDPTMQATVVQELLMVGGMYALIKTIVGVRQAVQGLSGVLGGSLNPAMLGIGVILSGAILAYGVYSKRKAEATQRTKELSLALHGEAADLQKAVGELMANDSTVVDMANSLKDFGFTWQDLANFVQGHGTEAFTTWYNSVKTKLDETGGSMNELYRLAKDTFGWDWAGENPRTLQGLDDTQKRVLTDTRTLVTETDKLLASHEKGVMIGQLLTDTTDGNAAAFERLREAQVSAADAGDTLGYMFGTEIVAALDHAKMKQKEYEDAIKDFIDTVHGQVDAGFALRNQINSLEDAQAEYAKAVAKANKTHKPKDVEDMTRAELALEEQIWATANATAEKVRQDNAGMDAAQLNTLANKTMVESLYSIANTLEPGSALRANIMGYIHDLEQIPTNIRTTVSTNIPGMQAEGDALFGAQWNRKASGGDAIGPTVVNEQGQEMVQFRTHVNIASAERSRRLRGAASTASSGADDNRPIVVQLVVDGRVLTEVVHDGLLRKKRLTGSLALS